MPKQNEINNMDSDENNTGPCAIGCVQTDLILARAQKSMIGIENERLILMLRYFSICFHIPLSNRDVSTYGYLICGFSAILL